MGRLSASIFYFSISLFTILGNPQATANSLNEPIWAKQATVLDLSCPAQEQMIASPDHRYILQVVCNKQWEDDSTHALRLITPDKHLYEAPLDEGAHELLWAPNSTAFFVDGGANGYAGFFVAVYQIEPSIGMHKETITSAPQRDMVNSFPPCKAYNRDERTCESIARNPEYNMSGLAWWGDSAAIYVFAEVPCSSSYGGIMCQVLGYELSVPDGRIVLRLSAAQAKQRWGRYAAWDIVSPIRPSTARLMSLGKVIG